MDSQKACNFKRSFRVWFSVGIAALLLLMPAIGCAGKNKEAADLEWVEVEDDDTDDDTGEGEEEQIEADIETEVAAEAEYKQPKERREIRKGISKVPSYGLYARSLKHYERELGIKFYKDKNGRYVPFAAASWDSFSIADASGECLYDVEVMGVKKRRLDVLLDLEVSEGPCGLKYPDTDAAVMERVSMMEGSILSYELVDELNGISFCSDKKFLQKVFQVPFDLESGGKDLERSLEKVAQRISNPLHISFGDIVFFDPYPGERSTGVYIGYGVVVYNTCFGAKIHHVKPKKRYRIYRLFNGFAWTHYKIHQEKFMMDYLGVER